jgi:hypothetical protein
VLLLNAAPDTTGLIPQEDMQLYKRFGNEIKRRFGSPIASTSGSGEIIELKLGKSTRVDHIILQEDIVFGERVREYVIEGQTNGRWQALANGTAVGYKRIEQFEAATVDPIRIRFTSFTYPPIIKNVSVYYVGSAHAATSSNTQNEVLVATKVIDQSGTFTIDLSDYINRAGQYELHMRTEAGEPVRILSSDLILQGVVTPGFTRITPNGSCSINVTAHPSGGKGTIVLTGKVDAGKKSPDNTVNIFLNTTK